MTPTSRYFAAPWKSAPLKRRSPSRLSFTVSIKSNSVTATTCFWWPMRPWTKAASETCRERLSTALARSLLASYWRVRLCSAKRAGLGVCNDLPNGAADEVGFIAVDVMACVFGDDKRGAG